MKTKPAPPAAAADHTLKLWVAPCRVDTTNRNEVINSVVCPVRTATINTRTSHNAAKGERKSSM